MLAKFNRLRKKKEFETVLRKGKGFKEDFLVLKAMKNNLSQTRVGLIVGVKVSKKATLRNKIKRRLKALIVTKISEIEKGVDIILIAKPGLEHKDFWEIAEILNTLLKRAKIIALR